MDVFTFRDQIVADYERFSRSFTSIRAADIRDNVKGAYRAGRFWPAPLIQLNPNFVSGGSIDDLVAEGVLDSECAKIFRVKSRTDGVGISMVLHRHQREAIDIEPADFAANADAKGIKAHNTLKTLRDALGYRLYFDLQRGWRITNPNVEHLRLLSIDYPGSAYCYADNDEWSKNSLLLASISPEQRHRIAHDRHKGMTAWRPPDEATTTSPRLYRSLTRRADAMGCRCVFHLGSPRVCAKRGSHAQRTHEQSAQSRHHHEQ